MDNVWIGRKLAAANMALVERFAGMELQAGEAESLVASLAPKLIREIGCSLVLEDQDYRLPFVRTYGLMRIPSTVDEPSIARAYNGLATLVSNYICALPGATPQMNRFARDAVRHAASVTMPLRRALLRGERRESTEAHFGGIALLVHPTRPTLSAG